MFSQRMTIRSICFATVAAALFCMLHGATADTEDLPIHAKGAWRSDAAGSGPWEARLSLLGNTISGILNTPSRPDLDGGRIHGSVSENSLEFTVATARTPIAATFSGSLSGTAFLGSFKTAQGERGSWAGSWKSDPPRIAEESPPFRPVPAVLLATHTLEPERPMILSATAYPMDGSASVETVASATVGANVLANDPNDAGLVQNEPEVAVDRNSTNRVVVGANDYPYPGLPGAGYYASDDGGATWPWRGRLQIPGFQYAGDPTLDFDGNGNVFYAGVAFNADIQKAIFVSRSSDGGHAFQAPVIVNPASSLGDKPAVVTDKYPGSPGFGNVYVTWFQGPNSNVRFAVSTDHGATFNTGGYSADSGFGGASPSIAVGIDGKVNILWLRAQPPIGQLIITQCGSDGTCIFPHTIAPPITLDPTPLPQLPGVRIQTSPALAIDTAPGGSGYFAVVWQDYRSGNSDIYFTLSKDNGSTWLSPRAIAADPVDEFFPALTIDSNHFQQVLYYRRTSQSTQTYNAYLITSGNGAGNFTAPVQLNDGGDIGPTGQFDPPGYNFIGDYIGIDSDTVQHPAWTDSRRGQEDIYTTTAVSGC